MATVSLPQDATVAEAVGAAVLLPIVQAKLGPSLLATVDRYKPNGILCLSSENAGNTSQ